MLKRGKVLSSFWLGHAGNVRIVVSRASVAETAPIETAPAAEPTLTPVSSSQTFGERAARRMLAAFTYRDFRVQWFGACTSSVGTWTQLTAQNWLVLSLTGSAFFLGLDAFLQQLPIMLFTLIGGVLADRLDRRRTLLMSQYIQMTTAATLAVLVYFGVIQIWHILLLSFTTGIAQSFGGPAYQALIPSLVEKKDLPNAVALNSIQFNVARVIGPLVFGGTLALAARWGVHRRAVDGALLPAERALVPRRHLHADVAAREAHSADGRSRHAGRAAERPHLRRSTPAWSRSSCWRPRRRSSGLRC